MAVSRLFPCVAGLICVLAMLPACSREESRPAPAATAASAPANPEVDSPVAGQPIPAKTDFGDDAPLLLDPTSAPADASAAESAPATNPGVPPFRPLVSAKVGDWAEYQALNSQVLRYEVVRADGEQVQTQVSVRQDGRPLGLPATREDARTLDFWGRQAAINKAARHAEPATIDAAGRRWNATLYEDKWVSEGVPYHRRTWLSPDVPVFGTVRMELYGDEQLEAKQELIGFGRK